MLFGRVGITLLFLVPCGAVIAQEPQPFLQPPHLQVAQHPGVTALAVSQKSLNVCNPSGDIKQNGSVVSVELAARVDENEIYNPATKQKEKVQLRSYGGCLSGPLLELHPGTTLRVHLENQLAKDDPTCPEGQDPPDGSPGCFNTINMHFHGLHVSPSGNSDNVLLNIAPQTNFDYEVNIPSDHPAGTFWYHAHRHGSTSTQVASGASGALIIRGDRRYTGGDMPGDLDTILHTAAQQSFPEQVFLFQQIPYACFTDKTYTTMLYNPDKTWRCPADKVGVVENFNTQLGDATLWDESGRFTSINGAVQPTITGVEAGAVQHWRMIHSGIHDTINLQIVPMNKTKSSLKELQGVFTGSPAAQAKEIARVCPTSQDPKDLSAQLVPQFEVASDGLTRTAIHPIGINKGVIETSVSGGIGTNFMQPGYRSDILLVFPHEGTYCVLNQAATPAERENSGNKNVGGQGTNEIQLLATVVVKGGVAITTDPETYVYQALYEGNKADADLPPAALDGLKKGDLTPWRGMVEDLKGELVKSPVQKVDFFIGNRPAPIAQQANPPVGPWTGAFGFYINYKSYDPDRIDFTRQVGTTDDWLLTAQVEPHIFHIHVNPFEIMDVQHDGKSIFGPDGECLEKPDSVGLQNQYCGMWHTYKDTVFVQPEYQVMIRTKYERYIGEFVIHCHILDHEDGGMMTNVQIVPDLGAPGNGIGMPGMHHAHSMINNPGK